MASAIPSRTPCWHCRHMVSVDARSTIVQCSLSAAVSPALRRRYISPRRPPKRAELQDHCTKSPRFEGPNCTEVEGRFARYIRAAVTLK